MPKIVRICHPSAVFALYAAKETQKPRGYPYFRTDILPGFQCKARGIKPTDALRRYPHKKIFEKLQMCRTAKDSPVCKICAKYGFGARKAGVGGLPCHHADTFDKKNTISGSLFDLSRSFFCFYLLKKIVKRGIIIRYI